MSPTKPTARGARLELAASADSVVTSRHTRFAPIKFMPPPARPSAVPRADALALLERCPPGGTALVCAGAGFGKSTLLAQWIASHDARSVWFALDESHNDPRRCLADLRTALARVRPELRADESSAFLTGAEAVELILGALATGEAACLVLDDLHLLGDGESASWLGRLAEHLPGTIRLAVGSRTEPPWPLHRLRAGGRLIELRGDSLRFSRTEVHEFLGTTLGLDLPGNAEEALAARTEGWPAGLQLAALALHGRDPRDAAATFTGEHRFVLDYLTSEVLEGLPAERLDFLLATSLLPRLDASLCDALLGRGDSQLQLEALEAGNLFLIPLDDRREVWRYHHLFADLLAAQLARRWTPQRVQSLQSRAVTVLEQAGHIDEAIGLAVKTSQWLVALDLLGRWIHPYLLRGETELVQRWCQAVPTDVLLRRPQLLFEYAIVEYAGFRYPRAAELQALVAQAAASSEDPALLAAVDTLEACSRIAAGDIEGIEELAARALPNLPADAGLARSVLWSVRALALARRSLFDRANRAYETTADVAQASGLVALAALARGMMGWMARVRGRLGDLEAARDAARSATALLGIETVCRVVELVLDSELCFDRGDPVTARMRAEEALRLARRGESIGWFRALLAVADAACAMGEPRRAVEALEEARMLCDRGQEPRWSHAAEILKAVAEIEACAQIGESPPWDRWTAELAHARALADTAELEPFFLPDHPRDRAARACARLLLAAGDFATAERLLLRLEAVAASYDWHRSELEIQVLRLLAQGGAVDLDRLSRTLHRGLGLGLVGIFQEPRLAPGLDTLLTRHPDLALSPAGHCLRRWLDQSPKVELTTSPSPPAGLQPAVDQPSQRELEVLVAASAGATNAEVARRLYLSPHTVKKHLENLYAKLGVRNRTEACARARELGLLE